jgi:ADP-ribose pyrophosphatase
MAEFDPKFRASDVKVLARETRYASFLQVDTLQLQHRLFEGGWSEPMQRELLVKTPAVGVLLFDPQRDELVMVRQFRVGMLDRESSPWPLELVAGLVDTDESLEEVAIREIQEETGLIAADLLPICDYYNSPGASSEKVSLFCARVDASQAGGYHGLSHEHEDIEVLSLSAAEALDAMDSGVFNNAMSMIALQWFAMNKQKLVQRWQ